ncbi:MAG: alpha/beta fold hydrolase [Oscillospiraceae bacterium]
MYANINGTKLFFDVAGKQFVDDGPKMREKPVCFLFHGGPGGDHSCYLPTLLPLAEVMQLVFIDHRNCGRSEACALETCTLKQNAADADALRAYLGLEKIYVLGQSYGGMVAQRYALDFQEHLHGAILVTTAPSYRFELTAPGIVMERGTDEQKLLWQKKAAGEINDLQDYLIRMGSLYHYKWGDEYIQQYLNADLRGLFNTEVNNYQRCGELRDFDLVDELHAIKCPVIIFSGKQDFITAPVHSEEIHRAIPQSELCEVDCASHHIFSDRPDVMFPKIEEFVKNTFSA